MTSAETASPAEKDLDQARPVGVTLTPAAIEKVKELLRREAKELLQRSGENPGDQRLRIAVQPGGCSGLRYQLFFDSRLFPGDHITRFGDSESDSGDDSGYESGSDE